MRRPTGRLAQHLKALAAGSARLLFVLLLASVTTAGAHTQPQAPAAAAPKPAVQAAGSAASLDQILKEISTFDGGIESEPYWKLRDYVIAHRDDAAGRAECEAKLLQFLRTPATHVAKVAASRHLRAIAGDTAIPALLPLLRDERTADLSLYVLQQIPGPAAEKALVQALTTATGATKTAIIGAIGRRGTRDAVPALAPLLQQPAFAVAAATALGGIGNEAAAQALQSAARSMTPEARVAATGALLQSGERWIKEKREADALKLYDALLADASLPRPARRAAALGRIAASGNGAPEAITQMLASPDADLRQAAIARVRQFVAPDAISGCAAMLQRLPEESQVQLLAVLAGYPREKVLPTVLQAAGSQALPVRLAALKALETVGDASVLGTVVKTAATARGAEQTAARATLGMLKGRPVDDAILSQLASATDDDVRGELLLAVADRRIFSGKPAVTAALASPSAKLRVQGLKALRAIGTPSDVAPVVELLLKSDDESEQAEAEATAAALASKTLRPEGRAAALRARLAEEKRPQARARLIGILPRLGDTGTLPLLRTALTDDDAEVRDAAVRALTSWPTSAARDDVLRLARDSRNETHKLLAIAGLVRLISVDRFRAPEAAVADLRTAAGFAWRIDEQRLVLGALSQFPCDEALEMANEFLAEPSLKAEAAAAAGRIKARLK